MSRLSLLVGSSLLGVCVPSLACAHLVNTRLGDFYGGVLHPLTGFESLLPWLALCILGALQGAERGRWLFLVFPLGLFAGTVLSILLPHLGFVAFLNMMMIGCVGILVALNMRLPLVSFLALSTVLALGQGYDNGSAMAFDTDRVLFIGGVTAVGYSFVALTSSGAIAFLDGREGWRLVALRAGGSWITAVGIMMLALQVLRVGSRI